MHHFDILALAIFLSPWLFGMCRANCELSYYNFSFTGQVELVLKKWFAYCKKEPKEEQLLQIMRTSDVCLDFHCNMCFEVFEEETVHMLTDTKHFSGKRMITCFNHDIRLHVRRYVNGCDNVVVTKLPTG